MYIANGTTQAESRHGSTRLHEDLTDAVNLMLWAGSLSDGQQGYAEWHIFDADDVPALREFLEKAGFSGPGDSIHSQQIYLTPSALDRLYNEFHVKPYLIKQYPGDAVFIPAGCPHQVHNLTAVNPLS